MNNQWSDLVSVARNDIVFVSRNKEYGAYQIRREYGRSLVQALLYSAISISVLFTAPFVYNLLPPHEEDTAVPFSEGTILTLPPQEEDNPPIPPSPPPPPVRETIKFTTPVVKEEDVPEAEIPPTQEEIKEKQVGEETQKGLDIEVISTEIPPSPYIDEKVYDPINIQEPATFPGGEAALLKFMSEGIQYPTFEQEHAIQGKVFLSFIIDKEGNVSKIGLVKGIKGGSGCDKEAIRVTGLLPKWTPGKQNGRAVNMRFILPVTFRLKN